MKTITRSIAIGCFVCFLGAAPVPEDESEIIKKLKDKGSRDHREKRHRHGGSHSTMARNGLRPSSSKSGQLTHLKNLTPDRVQWRLRR